MLPNSNSLESPRPYEIHLSQTQLAQALRSHYTAHTTENTSAVVWTDGDSEILVNAAQIQLSLKPGLILVELPVATDQTGKDSLVIPFSVGETPADACLKAYTETVPHGNPILAARWGHAVQEVLWQGILETGQGQISNYPNAEGMTISGLYTQDSTLVYIITRPYTAQEISEYYEFAPLDGPAPAPPEPIPKPSQFSGCLLALIRILQEIWDYLNRPRSRS